MTASENQWPQVVVSNAWRTDFQNDGQRHRRITLDYAWQGSTWTKTNEVRYVYDGMLVIHERDANNIPIKTYTRGLDLSGSLQGAGGLGGLLAMTDHKDITARHYYYHCDANGNVTALINEQQVVMARYAYDPYGNQISAVGPVSGLNPYRFSSKEWHPNSGLYYYGCRFYEPNLQRWMNRDPIGEGGGLNIFGFCGNSPVVYSDGNGLDFSTWGGFGTAYGGVGNKSYPFYPELEKARSWLAKCHPELCKGFLPIINAPGLYSLSGYTGQSALPFIILIDVPAHKRSVPDLIDTIAHECMHKKYGRIIGMINHWLNNGIIHDEMYDASDNISREYYSDPEGLKCKCKGNRPWAAPHPPRLHFLPKNSGPVFVPPGHRVIWF